MLEKTILPKALVCGNQNSRNQFEPKVEKRTLEGIDEIQSLCVSTYTSIKMHGHNNQWEVWVCLTRKTAHICLKGEQHELVNNTN